MNKEEKDIGKIMEEMLNRPLELIEENKKLKKKIERLQKENKKYKKDYMVLQAFYSKDYIRKYRIENKIKEYEDMLKTLNKKSDIDRIKAINERIIGYKELLGGENDWRRKRSNRWF